MTCVSTQSGTRCCFWSHSQIDHLLAAVSEDLCFGEPSEAIDKWQHDRHEGRPLRQSVERGVHRVAWSNLLVSFYVDTNVR